MNSASLRPFGCPSLSIKELKKSLWPLCENKEATMEIASFLWIRVEPLMVEVQAPGEMASRCYKASFEKSY
jgi:hypothetical protein